LAERGAYLEAIHVGQHDVDDHKVAPLVQRERQTLLTLERDVDLVSIVFQNSPDGLSHVVFIVDDENPGRQLCGSTDYIRDLWPSSS